MGSVDLKNKIESFIEIRPMLTHFMTLFSVNSEALSDSVRCVSATIIVSYWFSSKTFVCANDLCNSCFIFQAHKLATEAHLITSMRITDISIALKSARSRVRLNEIQSTLLEQRYE